MLTKKILKGITVEDLGEQNDILGDEIVDMTNRKSAFKTKRIPLLLSHWDSVDETCKLGIGNSINLFPDILDYIIKNYMVDLFDFFYA